MVRYVLEKMSRSQGHAYSENYDDLTIEHLVPQSSIDGKMWRDEEIGQIGNLILVTKDINQKLENKTFKEKRDILVKAGYQSALPSYFMNTEELTSALIAQRTEELARLAYGTVWKI